MKRQLWTISALSLLASACDRQPQDTDPAVAAAQESDDQGLASSPLQPLNLEVAFEEAAAEFDVPVELLESIAWVETRWHMVHAAEEAHPHGQPPAYGVMALRSPRLEDGAALAGVDLEAARNDAASNIRAAAAWMSARADALGVHPRDDASAWAEVAADYAGLSNPQARQGYVDGELFTTLRSGFVARTESGDRQGGLAPQAVEPRFVDPSHGPLAAPGPDYVDAIWRPSPNFSSRPSGATGDPQMVIVHSCEGSYSSCWSWLTNAAAGVSAHYVVNSTGSEVSQLVSEADKAWHIGATYDCGLNEDTLCALDGVSSNGFTIGVEHAGYASQTSWDGGQLDASAQLVCDITQEHGIPRDANHIVAHGQLQANRTDPGAAWPWDDYIDLVRYHCGEPPIFREIIVDNDNGNNDPEYASMVASGNWTASSGTSGYWGADYRFSPTQAVSDQANFWFYLHEDAAHTVDAWWTAGANRSPTAPFQAYNASGALLATVSTDQSADGGQWNELGTFNFTAGWNRIALSRWTSSGYVVIADAVRVR